MPNQRPHFSSGKNSRKTYAISSGDSFVPPFYHWTTRLNMAIHSSPECLFLVLFKGIGGHGNDWILAFLLSDSVRIFLVAVYPSICDIWIAEAGHSAASDIVLLLPVLPLLCYLSDVYWTWFELSSTQRHYGSGRVQLTDDQKICVGQKSRK